MKKRSLCLLVGMVLIGLCLIGPSGEIQAADKSTLDLILERGVLRIGYPIWPPFSFVDKEGKYSGIAKDVGEEIAKALEVKVEFIEDSTGTMIAGIQSGKFDMSLVLSVTLPRAKVVDFTDPLLKYEGSLLLKKELPISKWPDANDPKYTITVAKGSNTALYVHRMFPKANIMDVIDAPQGILAMKAGRAGLYASSYDTLLDIAKTNPDMRVLPDCFIFNPLGFTVKRGDQIFVNWLNWFIEDMKITHTIDRILEKYGARKEIIAELKFK